MANLVIDASLTSAWCFPDERTQYANHVLEAITSTTTAFAPRLWAYEVRNSILMGRIARSDAQRFLDSLDDLNIHLADPVSYGAVFRLAEANQLTVYDAAYLDLAIREGASLATLDDALRKASSKVGVALFEIKAT